MQTAFPNCYAEWPLFTELMVGMGMMFMFLNGCAKVGTPTGGQKDINLPVYLEGIPEDRSTNFNG